MSTNNEAILDSLSSLPKDIQRYSGEVADYIDNHVEQIADSIRESLSSCSWLPASVRPEAPPPPPVVTSLASTTVQRVQDWVARNKVLTGVIVVVAGTVFYRTYRNGRTSRKTRRAKKVRSGGRVEVVVLAGSPSLPLTRSLALDLERKGFVVFVVCNSDEDELLVHNYSRPDVKALDIDITDPPSAGASVEKFAKFLQSPHAPVPRAKQHMLELKAVVLIPSLNYQTSPIATIPPSSFADLFNTHLLHPILTIQSFLPLLTARLGQQKTEKPSSPKVMVLTPAIISSINPPFHAPEATVCSALSAFTEVLTAELRPLNIPVTHMQLGTFDFVGFQPATRGRNQNHLPTSSETLAWPETARQNYGRNFLSQSSSAISTGRINGLRASSLRELHNAVFDVIDGSITSGVVRIGLGANVYGFVGRWVPRGLVEWMMGIRKVDELATWFPSSSSSPRGGGSENGEASQDYVAVPMDEVADTHAWTESV